MGHERAQSTADGATSWVSSGDSMLRPMRLDDMPPAMAMAIKFATTKETSAERIEFGFMVQSKARGVPRGSS